jgi:PAS domain S-box-containing protein
LRQQGFPGQNGAAHPAQAERKADAPFWAAQNHLDMDAIQFDARQMRGVRHLDADKPSLATVVFPLTAVAFAAAIFIVDTFTPLGIAVAALYVVVVLMAGRFLERRGVLIVASSCIALTILAYAIQHGATYGPSLVRCVVSLVAIVITTFLALKSQAAAMTLREQADLLETTHDAIIVRNMNDVITFWNRGAEQLYEWSSEEAIGKVSHELLHTEFPAAREDLRSTLLHADRLEVELIHTKRDGTKVAVASRWSVQRDRAGRPIGTLETNNDITKRKQAEDALRRSEAYLAEAQILSRTGSFAWDVATGNIAWSDEAYRIFEHDRGSEPTIELVLARTHPEDRASLQQFLEGLSPEQKAWSVEHRVLLPSGAVKHIHVVAHATSDAPDRFEYVGALMDVTDAKRAQEALHQAQAEVAHVTRVTTLGELTASIAHEVNQPLAAIVTNGAACLRWLAASPPDLSEAGGAIERIIRDGNRASEVIRRLRDLTRKTESQMARLDINDLINDVVALVQRELMIHRVGLRLELAASPSSVVGDRVQLQQVIINLVMNGIEAMAPVIERPRQLWIRSRPHANAHILVSVQDSGMGLDPEQMDRMFNAFFTTKPDGMGMGLSICRSIIEAHGGELWALPNERSGATFEFTVPIDQEAAR